MPGGSALFGSDVLSIGVGSYHVTLVSEGEYFDRSYIKQFTLTISSNEKKLSYYFELN